MHQKLRFYPMVLAIVGLPLFALSIGSCKLSGWDTDLEAFVDYGRTIAYLDAVSYEQGSADVNSDVRSGTPVTVTVKLNNPKALALNYTIGADASLVSGTVAPPASTSGATDGISTATFTFTPTADAEHGDVTFKLGLSAPAINRTFDPATFKVRCDSPPDPVTKLAAGIRTDGKACIAFTLPEAYADADIAKVEVVYTSSTAGTSKTVTETVSRTGLGLTAAPSPAPLGSDAGAYVRYFAPDDVIAGNQYTFTVRPIDESGKRCESSTSASLAGNELYLGYDANGGTGTVSATIGYNGTTSTTIASASPLSRDGYGFTGWNTKADGTGTSYTPGDDYTFGTTSLMLYAQWLKLAEVTISISTPGYQGVSITQNGATVTAVTMDIKGTLTLEMPESDDAKYVWYIDGENAGVDDDRTWAFTPPDGFVGAHTISATATYNGVAYSANLVVIITNDAMVTVVPFGTTATYDMISAMDGPIFPEIWDKISPYRIAKTHTTYALWYTVYQWATSNGYGFENAGQTLIGTSGASEIASTYPVTAVSWADMIVWCNAYSEMSNLEPCYTYAGSAIKNSTDTMACGNVTYDRTKNGYRLPTEGEWQYAASGREEVSYHQISGCAGTDYANYAVYNNAARALCGSKHQNRLGLYDMSGNAWNVCFDRYPDASLAYGTGTQSAPAVDFANQNGIFGVIRGGSWGSGLMEIWVGYRKAQGIFDADASMSFRLARTITE